MAAKKAKRSARGEDEPVSRKKAKQLDDATRLNQMVKTKTRRVTFTESKARENFVAKRSEGIKEEKFKAKTTPLKKGGKKGSNSFKSKSKFKRK
jgi:hypothetical protein